MRVPYKKKTQEGRDETAGKSGKAKRKRRLRKKLKTKTRAEGLSFFLESYKPEG